MRKDIIRNTLLTGFFLLSISFLWEAPASGCGFFTPTVVDSTGEVGKYPSIALDYNNKAHISYRNASNNGLKYATNTSGSWVNIGGLVGGKYTSIATDPNNKVHISYYNPTDHSLSYATNASGGWVKSILDPIDGKYTSIAIDSNNKVHISYYIQNLDRLMYITNAYGSWDKSVVDQGLGLNRSFADEPGTSIALDSNNKVHISYLQLNANDCVTQVCAGKGPWPGCRNTVKYATNKNRYWTKETIYSYLGDIEYVFRPSLAIDSNNKAHIAFTYCDVCHDWLWYATNASGSWAVEGPLSPSDPTAIREELFPGMFNSIALDSHNKVHIMHSEWKYGRLWYTTKNASGEWTAYAAMEAVDVLYVKDTAVVVDAVNNMHTAYYEDKGQDLLYSQCPNLQPDLIITALGNPPASATKGSTFSVTDTTANPMPPCNNGNTAWSSMTRYRLSSDATITATDPLLTGGRSVPPLAGASSSTGIVMVTIPASIPVGTYYLGACADDAYNVSEFNESNNCSVSSVNWVTTTIQITQ